MVHIGQDLDTSGNSSGPAASVEMEIRRNGKRTYPSGEKDDDSDDIGCRQRPDDKDGSIEMRRCQSKELRGYTSRDDDEEKLLNGDVSSRSRPGHHQKMKKNQVLELFKELTVLSNLIIMWIVELAPFCIAFLIAGSLAEAGE